jgi:hypothetical protein
MLKVMVCYFVNDHAHSCCINLGFAGIFIMVTLKGLSCSSLCNIIDMVAVSHCCQSLKTRFYIAVLTLGHITGIDRNNTGKSSVVVPSART